MHVEELARSGPGSISLIESIFLQAGNEVSLTGNIEYPLK